MLKTVLRSIQGTTVPYNVPGTCLGRKLLERLRFLGRYISTYTTEDVQVSGDGKTVDVIWDDGKTSKYHGVWLRHNCICSHCYDTVTHQPTIKIQDLPLDIHIDDVKVTDNGDVSVTFKEENHKGVFTAEFLRENCYSRGSLIQKKSSAKIAAGNVAYVPEIQWDGVKDSDQGLYTLLQHINECGLCLIKNANTDGDLVERLAARIGPAWDNTYVKVWEVKNERNPTNYAYTTKEMQFHMDLPFYQAMPGLEFLHCLRFDESVKGGQTLFLDITQIAEEFRRSNPTEFQILSSVPFSFSRIHHDREYPVHMVIQRPIIQLNREQEITAVFWNPTVTGPLQVHENEVESFYKAYQLFAQRLYSFPEKVMSIRLKTGEIIAWNNRRLVHRRHAFSSDEGVRHFRGVYIDICEYKSRLEFLARKYGNNSPVKRVGNGDWL